MKCENEAFRIKIKMLYPEFNLSVSESHNNNHSSMNENGMSLEEKKQKETAAWMKKLKRMIS